MTPGVMFSGESSHVVWLGHAGLNDWEPMPLILAGDWTFVTRNAMDFRGPAARPGTRGQYADVAIHAGLICLDGPPALNLAMQIAVFDQALDQLEADSDLVDQVLEIAWQADSLRVRRYGLPAAAP